MLRKLCEKNRSVRNFDRSVRLSRKDLLGFVENARLSPSSVNLQTLKYFISTEDEINGKIFPCLAFAKKLEKTVPYEGKEPVAYIVICHDLSISETVFQKDVGICAQTVLLSAVEKGFNGCLVGNFSKEKLSNALSLPKNLIPELVIALGSAAEEVVLENADRGTDYYRDEKDVHHVPKRSLEEIIINQ